MMAMVIKIAIRHPLKMDVLLFGLKASINI